MFNFTYFYTFTIRNQRLSRTCAISRISYFQPTEADSIDYQLKVCLVNKTFNQINKALMSFQRVTNEPLVVHLSEFSAVPLWVGPKLNLIQALLPPLLDFYADGVTLLDRLFMCMLPL